MATIQDSIVSMPCQFAKCKFKAHCLVSPSFTVVQARNACRRTLKEHWALYHSTEDDKRLMMKQLGMKKL